MPTPKLHVTVEFRYSPIAPGAANPESLAAIVARCSLDLDFITHLATSCTMVQFNKRTVCTAANFDRCHYLSTPTPLYR